MAMPQVFIIYAAHSAANVSLVSWASITAFNGIWFLYAFVHKDRPLMLNAVLWIAVGALVTLGAVIY